ncbi:hypothetical protein NQ315_007456 [Exocentrus adspersus]|uniref:Uncharacterized protein n=1 Tax=Exocentrus adspersus TaxID=1586481 RepID=A0AAV8VHM5_9CUCU|nr:hypothetical protein NQ315_007456 [Exocentrus adspersus]
MQQILRQEARLPGTGNQISCGLFPFGWEKVFSWGSGEWSAACPIPSYNSPLPFPGDYIRWTASKGSRDRQPLPPPSGCSYSHP